MLGCKPLADWTYCSQLGCLELSLDIQEEFQTIVPRLTIRDKQISRIELIPCELEMTGPRMGCPKLASDTRGDEIFALLQKLSEPYGTRIKKRNWYATIDI